MNRKKGFTLIELLVVIAIIAVLMAILMMISVAVVFFQLTTDIVYTWLDPRIRMEEG